MKNLYLAILLLAFATNLLAFDKVWEINLDFYPNGTYYTAGHKELIVSNNFTFLKFNASTGNLVDSVTFEIGDLVEGEIGRYYISDDFQSIYISSFEKSKFNRLQKINIATKEIDTVVEVKLTNEGAFVYHCEDKASFIRISGNYFIFGVTSAYADGAMSFGYGGKIFYIKDKTILNTNISKLYNYQINSFKSSAIISWGASFGSKAIGTNNYEGGSYYNNGSINSSNYAHGELSPNDKYGYALINGKLIQYNFQTSIILNLPDFREVYSFNKNNENEVIITKENNFYHYDFLTESILDSISLYDVTYVFNNYNDKLLVVGNSKNQIIAYKSNYNYDKNLFTVNTDSIVASVGENIKLFTKYYTKPVQIEWDLNDGRTLNGDTIQFLYPKSGIYQANCKVTFKNDYHEHPVYIKVIDSLDIVINHSVEQKDTNTILKLSFDKLGSYNNFKYAISNQIKNNNIIFIDSINSIDKYSVGTTNIYNISATISNSINSKVITKHVFVPVSKANNISFELLNNNDYIDALFFKDNLIFNKEYISSTYTKTVDMGRNGYVRYYKYGYNNKLDLVNPDFSMSNLYEDYAYLGDNFIQYDFSYENDFNIFRKFLSAEYLILLHWRQKKTFLIDINKNIQTFNGNLNRQPIYFDFFKFNDDFYLNITNFNTGKTNINLLRTSDMSLANFDLTQSSYYAGSKIVKSNSDYYLLSVNPYLKFYKLDNSLSIIDTIFGLNANVVDKVVNKNNFVVITKDSSSLTKMLYFSINKFVGKTIDLDTNISYHQIYQFSDTINCLVGTQKDSLVIELFKTTDYKNRKQLTYSFNDKYKLFGLTKDNELLFRYYHGRYGFSMFKTKDISKILNTVLNIKNIEQIDSSVVDTTKNKGIIQNKNNQFGTVIQDQDFKAAKIYFKDSLDLSNSFVKIYTETGDEILTYSLSKDQKELPIQTDKLYIGTYYVRILNKNEEHNLGKIIIVR